MGAIRTDRSTRPGPAGIPICNTEPSCRCLECRSGTGNRFTNPTSLQRQTTPRRAGGSGSELAESFRTFLRPNDVLATWGTYATRMMAAVGLAPGVTMFDLRRVAADAMRASPGSIEECVATLNLSPTPIGRGRGGRRLGLMLAVLQALSTYRRQLPAGVSPGK